MIKTTIDQGTTLYFPEDIDPNEKMCIQIHAVDNNKITAALYTGSEIIRQIFEREEMECLVEKLALKYHAYKIKRGKL